MTEQQIYGGLFQIEAMFGRNFPEASKVLLIEKLSGEPIKSLVEAIKSLEAGDTTFLPSPIQIERLVKEKTAIARETEAQAEKTKFDHGQRDAFSGNGKIVAERSLVLIRSMLSGRITRGEFLEGIRHLDNAHQGIGFATEGFRLQKHYQERKLALDKRPIISGEDF